MLKVRKQESRRHQIWLACGTERVNDASTGLDSCKMKETRLTLRRLTRSATTQVRDTCGVKKSTIYFQKNYL